MAKIIHEQWKCIGCGACAAACSEFWEMGDDNKSKLKGANYKDTNEGKLGELTTDNPGCNKDAASACPVNCIHVIEESQKKE